MLTADALPKASNLLQDRLVARGWTVRQSEGSLRLRHGSWPQQMEVMLDPDAPAERVRYGLVIDFRSMPFMGERFKDLINRDREELLATYGGFRLRQLKADGTWASPVGDSAFLGGFAPSGGVARQTAVCIIERNVADTGDALVERFLVELSRVEEVGGAFASGLQRVYQRTVLASTAAMGAIYSDAAAASPVPGTVPVAVASAEPAYPWRR